MKEFNLSSKWNQHCIGQMGISHKWYMEEDVKEFIRLLKDRIPHVDVHRVIDKLAGDDLK